MSMVSDELMHDFLEEASELLDDVDVKLIELEKRPGDVELLNGVFRGFHTVKGGAGFLEATALVELCHRGESLLDALRTQKLELDAAMMDAILAATGVIREMFAIMAQGSMPGPADPEVLLQLQQALEGKKPAARALAPSAAVAATDWDGLFDEVFASGLGEARPGKPRNGAPAALAGPGGPVLAAEPSLALPQQGNESLRVDLGRFDQILNLSGEIGLSKNRLINLHKRLAAERSGSATDKALEATLRNLSGLVGELQNAVMKARMQEVGRVFQKYARMTRELGRQLGKNVELVIEGGATELDKTLLDQLNDPLVHLIRNAVDHGVEEPARRRAAGKPEKAIVTLAARQVGNTIVIEIVDDGNGIDAASLREKAVEKGLLAAHEASLLDDEKSFELIFLPGFSTRSEVSNISGRGVGMDVVRTNVQRLSGRIRVASTPGAGTRLSIVLPLTLAILPVLTVRVAGQMFAIPLTAVREVLEIETPPVPAAVSIDGEHVPVVALTELLGWETLAAPKVGVAVWVGERQIVIAADSFVGRDDVVIKPIQTFKPRGVSGATQSPDGEVVFVLDLNELIESLHPG